MNSRRFMVAPLSRATTPYHVSELSGCVFASQQN
jgi:hypothetical protein